LIEARRDIEFPPPDPSSLVSVQLAVEPSAPTSVPDRPHGGQLIVAAGFGALFVAVCFAFVDLLHLPSLSKVSVAALGGALIGLGVLKRKHSHTSSTAPAAIAHEPLVEVDLPSLTGQLSSVLGRLRREHGVAYRTRTWIEEVLPATGADLSTPELARDLLAAAALDAGGIRADVTALATAHSRDAIVATSLALLDALNSLLDACERSNEQPTTRPSDPSFWPPAAC
jgi:hypothetical protein